MSRAVLCAVLVAASPVLGCYDVGRTTRIRHPVAIHSTPANAMIWRRQGQQPVRLGNAPLTIQITEKKTTKHFNWWKSWLWNTGVSAATVGCAFGATAVDSEDKTRSGLITCAVISGLMALTSIGFTLVGHAKSTKAETSIEPVFIEASAPGFAKTARRIDQKRPTVHLTLSKARPEPARAAAANEGQAQGPLPIVAVFDVRITGAPLKAALTGEQLSELLHSRLAESGSYQVIPRSRLRRQLAQQRRESYKLCYDEGCQIELGKALAAQHSLATRLTVMEERCVLSAVLYDLATETSRAAAVVQTACGADDLLAALAELAGKLTSPKPAAKVQ